MAELEISRVVSPQSLQSQTMEGDAIDRGEKGTLKQPCQTKPKVLRDQHPVFKTDQLLASLVVAAFHMDHLFTGILRLNTEAPFAPVLGGH